ncbi:MAG: hypothetical protein B7X06_00860 [Verrucomicrobia bacterium 21-51-4]|nr:MAG: hypothetical protein B7X06_00860 [Verrucomicrobia bacterium 21-51-4]HQU08957.1 sulfite reductase subunit alpha [Opitutales bacterium]
MSPSESASSNPIYDVKHPFSATMTDRRKLCGGGSFKNTQHMALNIRGSGLKYQCGDSVGVYPQNDPADVAMLVGALGLQLDEPVVLPKKGIAVPLKEALLTEFSLTHPSAAALEVIAEHTTDASERQKLQDWLRPERVHELKTYLNERDWIDIAQEYPGVRMNAQTFVGLLRRLVPRLYSIASGPSVYPDEVHITVGVVKFEARGRVRQGVGSAYLAERVRLDVAEVPVFIGKSAFRLPEDDATDLIMIGPGTGVAPFRGFIQERLARKASGRLWLFFGEQQRAQDYLYGEEWERYLSEGSLARLSLAFSRDQPEKIYVQHRMLEAAAELWAWMQAGAYIYVCGDSTHMAPDVEAALLTIIQTEGGHDLGSSVEHLKELKKQKRYQKDVY